jgi:hypothetical protein
VFDNYNNIVNEIGDHLGGSSDSRFHSEPCYICKMFVFSMATYSKYCHDLELFCSKPQIMICLICHCNIIILYYKEKMEPLNKLKNELSYDYCICHIDFNIFVNPEREKEKLFIDNICKFCDIESKLLYYKKMIKETKQWKKGLNKQKDFI